ncbi:MAG: leucyl aminopeptidase family protein [Aquidulcibacter sp.]|jgi:leucyl aminopeptidase|uniref:leucyl aminopeptidase family protein n=1 Tax=Aquidulcibacter sp. TaxID=2052990 RepID=UPI0022BB1621|nr:leucyl aminopeptidase family protein [Aquidulcibacter sp.]MCE2891498.1 leucyl aminopeptidase family protein [Hyphomonadaceae bacterium]MCZ8207136.1 leucyl aminopeptidase family protein [Aquidulcibacter sp.]
MHPNIAPQDATFIPIHAISSAEWPAYLEGKSSAQAALAGHQDFRAQAGRVLVIPAPDGGLERVLFGLGAGTDTSVYGALASKLPAGDYRIASPLAKEQGHAILVAYLLGAYVFDRYKRKDPRLARLIAPAGADVEAASRTVAAVKLGRDLVNTPPNDMGPDALEATAVALGESHGAEIEVIRGAELLAQNYPLIHAVGRGAAQDPRLVVLRIGRPDAYPLALVGKGVTFDTGGLNLKPGAGMALMKKDMGGAACALALFSMLAEARLDVRLSVYLPIVENAMDGNSFRPSDVIRARNGLSVEIDNTDAEGRLILADAVTRASEDGNAMILDMATLTGAARVALGPELPPFFTEDEELAAALNEAAALTGDHLWRMPLWRPYEDDLDSPIADMKNSGGPFAGAINGALFISKFVNVKEQKPIWAHFDVYCWNPKEKPGRPQGGEVHAVRAIEAMLRKRFG